MKCAWIAVVGLTTLSAAQHARQIGGAEPFPHHVASLPAAQRRAIEEAIEPSLWDSFGDIDDADTMEDAIKQVDHDLRYDRRMLGKQRVTLIHAYNASGCGAVGNCRFFVLDSRNHLLLSGVSAKQVTILPERHHGLPDILLGGQMSARQTSQDWYAFDGTRYKADRCAVDTVDGKVHREFHSCGE